MKNKKEHIDRVMNGTEQQKVQVQNYSKMVKAVSPKPKYFANCLKAFWVGGLICLIAQGVQYCFLEFGDFTKQTVGSPTSAVMILLAVILTACGVYDKISQYAGAGSAVPITGFANSMSSAALEYKSEGFVLGVGGNMFKVAGPVIVFGAAGAFIVSIGLALWYTLGGGGI